MRARILPGALVTMLSWAGAAEAQPYLADARRGSELSEKLCSDCHDVSTSSSRATVSSDVLSFRSIANQPGATAERLAGRIIIPHPAMPDTQLTVQELRDIVAHILSLRRGD